MVQHEPAFFCTFAQPFSGQRVKMDTNRAARAH